jgi:hypothetical protein
MIPISACGNLPPGKADKTQAKPVIIQDENLRYADRRAGWRHSFECVSLISFAFFAAVFCGLCGKKTFTAKIAKDARNSRRKFQAHSGDALADTTADG